MRQPKKIVDRSRELRLCLPGCDTWPMVRVSWDEWYCTKHARTVADRLCRIFVMERDRYTCRRCEGPATDWAHILTRAAAPALRWEPDNSLGLCRMCHVYFHMHPARFEAWISDRYGPDRWDELHRRQADAERRGDHVDHAAVIRGFRERGLTAVEMERYASGRW